MNRNHILRWIAAAGAALLLTAALPARAELHVTVDQGNAQPLPIAIPDFTAPAAGDIIMGQNIAKVVRADLERSGLFRPLDPKSFIEKLQGVNVTPQYASWRTIGAQALVSGVVQMQGDGRLAVDFRLWDVVGEQSMVGQHYGTQSDSWRRIAHKIADMIYERITGEKGYFDTRIVFISESGPPLARRKMLTIMDQDGYGPNFLTHGNYMVLTPRFSPTGPADQTIAYLSYIGGKPKVYLFDIDSGRQEQLGSFPNMTFSPRFSPDGNRVAMSLETAGNSDIYVMDLRTRAMTRLTKDPGIDTAPSFSPDGTQIAFESDRGGSQQIYVMGADGSNQHRISFGAGRNGTPVWSPRGDLIAFTNQSGGFHVGVMKTDGSGVRILTTGWEDEGPTWAPNGRVIMFGRTLQGGRGSQIWSIDVSGRNERRVPTPADASDPAWSPLLQ